MTAANPHKVSQLRPEPVRLGGAPPLSQLLNLPNVITLARLISIPFFLALLSRHRFNYALVLFAAAALTDALDGTLARWSNSKTELGAFLDPFADKLLLVSSFVVLTVEQIFPAWLLIGVVVRDIVVVFGYFMLTFLVTNPVPVRPSYLGKASTFLQLACVVGALCGFAAGSRNAYWYALLYATVAVTGLSGLQYIYRGLVILNSSEPQMF
ncbi:MAG TPA: CDP-alcohol phosphatidyltransferase family protein [Candidatus Binataceae bacterium]